VTFSIYLWSVSFISFQVNITWPVPPPSFNGVQTIKVGISNNGQVADDVSFHVYLPDYAEMTLFSMETSGLSYTAKKTSQKAAHDVLKRAREEDHDAAIYIPKTMLGKMESLTYSICKRCVPRRCCT